MLLELVVLVVLLKLEVVLGLVLLLCCCAVLELDLMMGFVGVLLLVSRLLMLSPRGSPA